MTIGFVSLGCSKNLIDTEVTIGKLKDRFTLVTDPKKAEIIVVNTCGFITSAKEEAINTILEMADYKNKNCKYLIVMGCLVERYYEELKKALPEVDLFIKIDDYPKIVNLIDDLVNRKDINKINITSFKSSKTKKSALHTLPMFNKSEYLNRQISTGNNYAYLKIAEGCSNMCAYCSIPYIRGLYKSRPMEDILDEAQMLAKKGIKEIILIAQDTTKYGTDLYGKESLPELLTKMQKIDGIEWIRFLYAYPEGITDELIRVVKENNKICNYFDIPIQHISDSVLKRMNRKTSKKDIKNVIKKIRHEIPDVTLRTTLMVGFPGETEKDFNELCNFVRLTKFDKLGAFKYSKEEGTLSYNMTSQVHHKTKERRYNTIMNIQKDISKEKLKEKIGKNIYVLVEGKDSKYFYGRSKSDAPDIDGIVYLNTNDKSKDILNSIVKAKVVDVLDYDLIAEII